MEKLGKALYAGAILGVLNVLAGDLWYLISLQTGSTMLPPVLMAAAAAILSAYLLMAQQQGRKALTVLFWVICFIVFWIVMGRLGFTASGIYSSVNPEYRMGANDKFGYTFLFFIYLTCYWPIFLISCGIISAVRSGEKESVFAETGKKAKSIEPATRQPGDENKYLDEEKSVWQKKL